MLGNVSEFTEDWNDRSFYKYSPKINPQGPLTGTRRAIRGGSWGDILLRKSQQFGEAK